MKARNCRRNGSVLIIVLWIALGLVSVALYFANSMIFELRASDNRVAGFEAEQAADGAARFVGYLLTNLETPGELPDLQTYPHEAVPLGDASFWLIGRDMEETVSDTPYFSLVDESSKLNLNRASTAMLEMLPRMTPALAAAIVDWRDTNSDITVNGAESESYAQRQPSYLCKNAPFETVEELKLVLGMDSEVLYGEDSNMNGVLDANENDGDLTPPNDNRDGKLDAGIVNYLTVFTRGSTTRTNGAARASVANGNQLRTLLQEKSIPGVDAIITRAADANSVLDFYVKSRMSAEDFAKIEDDIMGPNDKEGLVNVNTASATVLAAIPGIGPEKVSLLTGYRTATPDKLASIAWVKDALNDPAAARQAGQWITGKTYQYSADVAAVGHYGRGYRRVRYVFDTTEGTPRIVFRQDLSHLGWALGRETRETILLANQMR